MYTLNKQSSHKATHCRYTLTRSKTMVHFIWPVMTEKLFSLPLTKVDILFGHVRMYATPYPISWIIFKLDLEQS